MLKVTSERWRQAQEWELEVWRGEQAHLNQSALDQTKKWVKRILGRPVAGDTGEGDDWNVWWADQFDQYQALPKALDNVVELGCGPYTNIRILLQGRTPKHVVCSDPLVKDYVTFSRRWLSEAWKARRVLIDDHPIEECPFASDYFELTVMNNVLDHVQDAGKCLAEAVRITKPGGYLIVGQDLSDSDDIAKIGFDVGHPITLDQEALDQALLPAMSPVFYKILPREAGRNPPYHYGTYLFIGQKVQNGGSE